MRKMNKISESPRRLFGVSASPSVTRTAFAWAIFINSTSRTLEFNASERYSTLIASFAINWISLCVIMVNGMDVKHSLAFVTEKRPPSMRDNCCHILSYERRSTLGST
ncbi:hypothetical protein BC827DRAFT_483452 [Russula dissimulans]|nr:hypothetical protein BC827DRAFT_483452 [Russula dissimulans]